jgi:hypothetical protein
VYLTGGECLAAGEAGGATLVSGGANAAAGGYGGEVNIAGGDASDAAGTSGAVTLRSGADTLLMAASIDVTAAARGVLSLCGTVNTTKVPGGDSVVFVNNATTAPSTNPANELPVGGFVMYSDSGAPTFKLALGDTIGFTAVNTLIGGTLATSGLWTIVGPGSVDSYSAFMTVRLNGTNYKIGLYT